MKTSNFAGVFPFRFYRFMAFISVLGMMAACLTTAAFVPQAVKTIRTRSTAGLSINTYILLFAGTVCWLIYGILIGNLPVILANAITALLTGIILFLIIILRKNNLIKTVPNLNKNP